MAEAASWGGSNGQQTEKQGPGAKRFASSKNGKCSYGMKCDFEHVCTVCLKSYPKMERQFMLHDSPKGQ